jgi:hypothetical protein
MEIGTKDPTGRITENDLQLIIDNQNNLLPRESHEPFTNVNSFKLNSQNKEENPISSLKQISTEVNPGILTQTNPRDIITIASSNKLENNTKMHETIKVENKETSNQYQNPPQGYSKEANKREFIKERHSGLYLNLENPIFRTTSIDKKRDLLTQSEKVIQDTSHYNGT